MNVTSVLDDHQETSCPLPQAPPKQGQGSHSVVMNHIDLLDLGSAKRLAVGLVCEGFS